MRVNERSAELTIVGPDQLDELDEELHLVQVGFAPAESVDVHVGAGDGVPVEGVFVGLGALYPKLTSRERDRRNGTHLRLGGMDELESEALDLFLVPVDANGKTAEAVGEVGGVDGDAVVRHFGLEGEKKL
jgi:hypothetical protein